MSLHTPEESWIRSATPTLEHAYIYAYAYAYAR